MRFVLGTIAGLALLAFAFACGDAGDGGEIKITMTDDSLTLDYASVPKGPIEFAIRNDGEKTHSLLIIKTNIPPVELPTEDDGSVDTDAADVDVVHEVDEIEDDDDTSRTYQLDPGNYVLVSNEVQEEGDTKTPDYGQGMYAALVVTEGSVSASAAAATSTARSGSPTSTR